MKNEPIYRVGDIVYHLEKGKDTATKGVVVSVTPHNIFSVIVDITSEKKSFTDEGREYESGDITLSFTPYNIHTGGRMKNLTFNGLKDVDDEIKSSLIKDAYAIINSATSMDGHLGDIISCLGTTISSIEIKKQKLIELFNQQKGK